MDEELLEMAEKLNDPEKVTLSDWECDFHESVLVALRAGRGLTPKQESKLRSIYEREQERGNVS